MIQNTNLNNILGSDDAFLSTGGKLVPDLTDFVETKGLSEKTC